METFSTPPKRLGKNWDEMKACCLAFCFFISVTLGKVSAAEIRDSEMIRSRIPREYVESIALATVGYSKKLHILELEFINGALYRYLDVPASIYREMMSADSKTRYYDFNIKGKYRSLRLRPPNRRPRMD